MPSAGGLSRHGTAPTKGSRLLFVADGMLSLKFTSTRNPPWILFSNKNFLVDCVNARKELGNWDGIAGMKAGVAVLWRHPCNLPSISGLYDVDPRMGVEWERLACSRAVSSWCEPQLLKISGGQRKGCWMVLHFKEDWRCEGSIDRDFDLSSRASHGWVTEANHIMEFPFCKHILLRDAKLVLKVLICVNM